MSDEDHKVRLGDTDYFVCPQPIARVTRQLATIQGLSDVIGEEGDEVDFSSLVLGLGDSLYDVLHAFIPDLMAKYKFHGYATNAAYEAGEYDPEAQEAKNSPTLPQLIDALEAAYAANGGERIKGLVGKTLGPSLSNLVRKWIVAQITASLEGSETSPSTNGASPLERSTEIAETSEDLTEPPPVIEGSPSLASSSS